MPSLRVSDFSGGITDNYLDGFPNQYQKADNLLIMPNRKLITRYGSTIYNSSYYQIPVGAQRINRLFEFSDQVFQLSGKNIYYIDSGWNTLTGPSSNTALTAGTVNNFFSAVTWNNHLFITNDAYSPIMKIYKDSSGDFQVRTAGLPELASSPTVTPDNNDGKSYIYYFLYYYTYTVGTVTFEDFGGVVSVTSTNSADFSGAGHYNDISGIPAISNGSTDNYDTSNIKVKIYRTEHNGTVGKYVGQVTNGTTTFTDDVADGSLGVEIYTTGGVLENGAPPLAKYLAIANNILWYANIKDGTEVFGNVIRQSFQNDPDSLIPYEIKVEEDITAISNIDIFPIVFGGNTIFRLEGYYDSFGTGTVVKRKISDSIGCISNDSIVKADGGLYFAGNDGFYFTDGYRQPVKISENPQTKMNINDTYETITSTSTKQKRIMGAHDKYNSRIYWTCQIDSTNSDNDSCLVFDKRFRAFTTVNGNDNFAPTWLMFDGDIMYRADTRGYVFTHSEDYDTDLVVDTSAVPTSWDETAIIFDYRSIAFSFGADNIRKWVDSVTVIADSETNISLSVQSNNDDSGNYKELKNITFRGNLAWGDTTTTWGDETIVWNFSGMLQEKRRFPAKYLRCNLKQIKLTNAYTVVDYSDNSTTATVNSTAKTALLDDATTYDWRDNIVGYYVAFSYDNYGNEYEITARAADTITFSDSDNTSTNGSQGWIIKGYPKEEKLKLLSYSINFTPLSDSFGDYNSNTEGSNA